MTRRLVRLDERVVPGLGRVLRSAGRAAVASVGLTGPPGRLIARVLRRYPVALVAVGLIAMATALITLTGGDQQSAVRPKASTVVPPLTGQQLGPVAGSTVSSYLAAASLRRQQLSSLPAPQPVTAVVDFVGYLSPRAISTVFDRQTSVKIVRGFARVPPPAAAPIHVLTTGSAADLAGELSAARSAASTLLRQYQVELSQEARHPSASLLAAISAGSTRAAQARADAGGLTPTCACVFALVVTGPVSELERVGDLADVRVLDPAPPASSLQQLAVAPLEPQVTGVVPQLEFAGE